MSKNTRLPLTALLAVSLFSALVYLQILPPGLSVLASIKALLGDYFFIVIFLIILLESIIYLGFYFPGQFFAVMLVVLAAPSRSDIVALTLAMVLAATIGSAINFYLGYKVAGHRVGRASGEESTAKTAQAASIRQLLLAMIHINMLAFFMFKQGQMGRSAKIIGSAAILNLPYYLLLIAATATLDEQVMQLAESTWLVISLLLCWFIAAACYDYRKSKQAQRVNSAAAPFQ